MNINPAFLVQLSAFLAEEPDLQVVAVLQKMEDENPNLDVQEKYFEIQEVLAGDVLPDPSLARHVWDIVDELEAAEAVDAEEQRQRAVSTVIAAEASLRDDVREFRRSELDSDLIAPERIESWLNTISRQDGEPRPWVAVPVPSSTSPATTKDGYLTVDRSFRVGKTAFSDGLARLWYEKVSYYTLMPGPASKWKAAAMPVAPGGVLNRLRCLSERLAREFHWQLAVATSFVISGVIPDVPHLEVCLHEGGELLAASRVRLDVSVTATPAEVAEAFKEAREKSIQGKAWTRRQSIKHLRLAEFCGRAVLRKLASLQPCTSVSDCLDATVWDWGDLMAEWNRTEQKHTYVNSDLRTFKRDCRHAVKRILNPGAL